jgi:mRNA interferase MazF
MAGRLRRSDGTRAIGAPTSRRSFRRSSEREPRRGRDRRPDYEQAPGLASHVEIEPETSGLDEVSYAKCEDVKSISEQRLIARLGAVSDALTFEITRILRFLLDI